MKVLFFITGLGRGGAERQLYNLVEGLKKKKIELKVISIFGGDYEDKFKKLGIEVEVLSKNNEFKLFQAIKFFKYQIKEFKPEIVHSFLYHSNIIAKLSLFFMKKNFKLICSYRSLTKKYPLIAFLEFFKQWKADLLISNSKRGLLDLNIYNIFKINKKVIYNGFNSRKLNNKKVKELKNKYEGKKVILTVGRLSPEKDYFTNIRVAKELSKKRDDFLFLYVGDGNSLKYLEFANELGVQEKIEFLGKVNYVLELMLISDIFFLPTLYESQCNALIEAMDSKVPIVTTNLLENRELVQSAKFVESENYKLMAKNINSLLNKNDLDLNLNKKFVQENLSFDKMIEKYYKVYKELLN